jgi:DNA-binding NarL/FixJ family response regulator
MNQNSLASDRVAVVVGPHPLFHEGLRVVLGRLGVSVVATTPSPHAAPDLVAEHRPDVLVADADGPADETLACVRESRRYRPDLVAIAVVPDGAADHREAAFAAGATACLVKTAQPDEVAVALRHALEGSTYVLGGLSGFVAHVRGDVDEDRALAADADAAASGMELQPRLTRRELEVLRLAAEGRSNRDVAKVLWVTDQTVKFHLANVYRKLGVSNRVEAGRWARANGLLEPTVESPGVAGTLRTAVRALAGARER